LPWPKHNGVLVIKTPPPPTPEKFLIIVSSMTDW